MGFSLWMGLALATFMVATPVLAATSYTPNPYYTNSGTMTFDCGDPTANEINVYWASDGFNTVQEQPFGFAPGTANLGTLNTAVEYHIDCYSADVGYGDEATTQASRFFLSQTIIFVTDPPVICGDGVINGDEVCDDGNTVDGDGCSSDCMHVEACYSCTGAPSVCTAPSACYGAVLQAQSTDRQTVVGQMALAIGVFAGTFYLFSRLW